MHRLCPTNYQNIYGTAYGVDLWKHDFGDDSLVKYIKAVTMEELTQVVSMDLLAQSREVALSEDELSAISEAAAEYYASLSKEENTYLEVTESDISEYYQHMPSRRYSDNSSDKPAPLSNCRRFPRS